MLSNSQFFILGATLASLASPYNLQMYKITFSSTSVDWANQIVCPSLTWSASNSESILSSDRSKIYLFFIYGSPKYLYFAGLSVSDGSVITSRYKSNAGVNYVQGSASNGDFLVASTSSPTSVVIYCISSSTFTIKSFSDYLNGLGVEPSSGR